MSAASAQEKLDSGLLPCAGIHGTKNAGEANEVPK